MMPAMQAPTARRGFARRLAAIAAGGLAVRLVYSLVLTPHLRGLGDATYYHDLANALADGRGFVNPATGMPTALHPPLFPLVLAPSSLLGLDTYNAHRVVVCLIGTATIVCVGLLARQVAGDRAGLLAAAVAAVSPVLISADGAVMSETLLGLLVVLAVLAAYRLASMRSAVLLGAIVGLATLTRGEALLLLPLLLPWRRPKLAAAVVAAFVVVLVPWTVRNLSTFDKPVALSTNDGGLVAGANCPSTYKGRDIGSWDIRCVPTAPASDESVASQRARTHGVDYATDHASRVPLVVAARLGRTFELLQPVRQAEQAEGRAEGLELAGAIVWWALLPLGVYGLVLLRRRGVPITPLLAPFALAVAATLIGYGVPRFRHPADVALAVLAGVALDALTGSAVASPRSTGTGGLTRRLSRSAGRSTT
jgi:4-amino-4-deoxy-L-arabinose transferase-like glycosyltransferase